MVCTRCGSLNHNKTSIRCILASSYVPSSLQSVNYVDAESIQFKREHPDGPPSAMWHNSDWHYSDSDSGYVSDVSDSTSAAETLTLTVFDARMMMRNMSLDGCVEMIRALEFVYEEQVDLQCEEEEAEAQLREDEKCSVCLQRFKDTVLAPCGHKCVCNPCALILSDRTTSRKIRNKCPICRKKFTTSVKVFE